MQPPRHSRSALETVPAEDRVYSHGIGDPRFRNGQYYFKLVRYVRPNNDLQFYCFIGDSVRA